MGIEPLILSYRRDWLRGWKRRGRQRRRRRRRRWKWRRSTRVACWGLPAPLSLTWSAADARSTGRSEREKRVWWNAAAAPAEAAEMEECHGGVGAVGSRRGVRWTWPC